MRPKGHHRNNRRQHRTQHEQSHYSITQSPQSSERKYQIDKRYQCPKCENYLVSNTRSYKRHWKAFHPNNPQILEIFNKRYQKKYQKKSQANQEAIGFDQFPRVQTHQRFVNLTAQAYCRIYQVWKSNQKRDRSKKEIIFCPSELNLDFFIDPIETRKNLLNREVEILARKFHMEDWIKQAEQMQEFQDENIQQRGRIINFAWDLLVYFKPDFAAVLKFILLSFCVDPRNINGQQWQRFKQQEWSQYGFFEDILKQYHKQWIHLKLSLLNI